MKIADEVLMNTARIQSEDSNEKHLFLPYHYKILILSVNGIIFVIINYVLAKKLWIFMLASTCLQIKIGFN